LAHALVHAVSVLIIACPCALGLATPMRHHGRDRRGASAGVLIRQAEPLELMEKVDTLVLDKTGTLTEGKPRLASVIAFPHSPNRMSCDLPPASNEPANTRWPMQWSKARGERGVSLVPVSAFQSMTGRA